MTTPRRRQIRQFIAGRRPPIDAPAPIPRLWMLRYYLYRYGHQLAYVMIGLGCFGALWALLTIQNREHKTGQALAALIKSIQIDRRNTVAELCASNNHVTMRLRALIVQGAVGSRVFEPIYRQYHAAPYKQRVVQARKQAASLKIVDCTAAIERIEKMTPPPPVVP